jgi:lysozyme
MQMKNKLVINQKGLDLIKKYEGFVATPYKDCAGFLTIGYGHLCKKNENFTIISKSQALEILKQDIKEAENAVNKLVSVELNSNQFSALVSFTFNLGYERFKNSTLLKKVNRNKFFEIPNEFIRWIYTNKIKRRGLLKRRLEEAFLFIS